MVDSVSVRFKTLACRKMPLNIRIQWNAGTACVSECVLKTLACRGLRVGPSKDAPILSETPHKRDTRVQNEIEYKIQGMVSIQNEIGTRSKRTNLHNLRPSRDKTG